MTKPAAEAKNLTNPAWEPSDEALKELAERAFRDVGRKHREALLRMRRDIAEGSAEVLRELAQRDTTET